ncbi:cytochrome P450 [Streptomyces sp. NPDC087851]|uniref:cytochrome P450 n=1 Tax=Streptomyces sp. NPDC087851 TaxID=3365810 RepID=UPI0037FC1BC4
MTTPTIDLTDPELFLGEDAGPIFRQLRHNDPVHRHPLPDGGGFWALTRYADVETAYNDHTSLSSEGGPMLGGSFRSAADPSAGRMLVASDLPRQRHIRQQVHRAFSNGMLRRIATQVTTLVDTAVRRAVADGGCDFATDIAPELPAGAIMAMMGVSHTEAHELIGMTRRMIGFRDPVFADPGEDERIGLAVVQAEIFEFFAELLADRRKNPKDDLVSMLLQARRNGRPWPEEDILFNCMNVAVGGNETSSYTACAGILALHRNPAQKALLQADPELTDGAVNEMLRWSSTNAYVMRQAVRDFKIGGRLIQDGDTVTLWNASANFDETRFPDPDTFDITRTPNRHLSFGIGIHRCIGAMLAQIELGILVRHMTDSRVSFTVSGPVRRLRSNFIRGTTSLPLTMTATSGP